MQCRNARRETTFNGVLAMRQHLAAVQRGDDTYPRGAGGDDPLPPVDEAPRVEGAGIVAAEQMVFGSHSRSRDLIAQAMVYDCYRATLVFTEAWSAYVRGDRAGAGSRVREALALAQEGTRRFYLCYLYCALPRLLTFALNEGIEVTTVRKLIRLFRLKPPKDAPENWPWPVRIVTLGRFEVQVAGEPMEFSRKLPRKTLLLLKSIVALGGRSVSEEALCDALWTDEEADAALNALAITIVRLRKLLGTHEAVIQQGGRISLNPELCRVDAWSFERLGADNAPVLAILNVYGGAFLPEEEGEPWSVAARERLRGKFKAAKAGRGRLLYGADGPVRAWVNGRSVDLQPGATNPAVAGQFEAPARWRAGVSSGRRRSPPPSSRPR